MASNYLKTNMSIFSKKSKHFVISNECMDKHLYESSCKYNLHLNIIICIIIQRMIGQNLISYNYDHDAAGC